MTNNYRQCVSIVILNTKGDVLLVHKPRKNDSWQIPQGGIEEGETAIEAGKRELQEETNIVLKEDPTLCTQFYQYDYPEGFIRAEKPKYDGQHLQFVFSLVPKDTEVIVDQRELDAFKWVKPNKMKKYLKRADYRKVVEEVVELITL
jgi:putative (di)nucleoside polyphosphate hydrolase